MFNNQERELKVILNKEQYDQLLNSYDFDEPILQKNTYFDSFDQQLKKAQCAVRIRNIGSENILTVKKPKDAITKYEYEFPISPESYTIEDLHPSEKDHLESIIHLNEKLYPTVVFETIRRNLKTRDAVISLDKTVFANHTDYELEYEYSDDHDGISRLNEFLKPIHITYQKNGPSKLARAIADQEKSAE